MSDATIVDFESWQAPDLTQPKEKALDAAAIAALRQSAYDEGFAQGVKDGEAQGFAVTQDRADQFLALLQGIDQPLVAMDAHLAQEVAHLAALVGAELARCEITADSEVLYRHVQRISEALPALQHPPKIFSEAAWVQMGFLLKFWMEDSSADFEKTDQAIEKSVQTAFDVFDNTPLSALVDFGKFLWKEKFATL